MWHISDVPAVFDVTYAILDPTLPYNMLNIKSRWRSYRAIALEL